MIKRTTNVAGNASGPGPGVPFEAAEYDTTFQPDDDGLPQRFWLGVDATFVDGDVSVADDEITETAHGFVTGEGPVRLTSGGTLPAGLALATDYWIIRVDDDTLKFALSRGNAIAGTDVDITAAAGGGTHRIETEENLVVPAGVSHVRLRGNLLAQSDLNGSLLLQIGKNFVGNLIGGGHSETDSGASSDENDQVSSAVLEVSEGDKFQLFDTGADAYTIEGTTNRTWFSIEVVETTGAFQPAIGVETPFIGARAIKSGTQSIAAESTLSFDAEDYDTGYKGVAFHDNVTNNSRMTVPAGVTRIRLIASIFTDAVSEGDDRLWIFKDGTTTQPGVAITAVRGINSVAAGLHVETGVIDVADGDFFEVRCVFTATKVVQIAGTFFAMEIVETADAQLPPADIGFFTGGVPTVVARRFTLPQDLINSQGFARTAANAQADFDLQRNEVSVGTLRFAASGTVATFIHASDTVFVPGDRLSVIAPNPADANLADISFTLFGQRQ